MKQMRHSSAISVIPSGSEGPRETTEDVREVLRFAQDDSIGAQIFLKTESENT
jgi:hypothetical protein